MKTETKIITKQKSRHNIRSSVMDIITQNMVVILFAVMSIVAFSISTITPELYVRDIISRVSRNSFLVLSLIIPVVAGMGLNFSIVLGAMTAAGAMIYVTHWGITGFPGIIMAWIIVVPPAILLGYLTGKLFNKAKGQEMITGLILGFFATAWFTFIFLQLVGSRILPMDNPILILSSGVGVRTTVDLQDGLRYGLEDLFRVPFHTVLIAAGILGFAYLVYSYLRPGPTGISKMRIAGTGIMSLLAIVWAIVLLATENPIGVIGVPVATWMVIAALCLFLHFFSRTKLGQDLRTVGQDRHVASVSGINVDRIRIIAIIMSTVLAAWGHVIFLQNMGAFSTYGSHQQIGLYSVAAILIGGATVARATIGQALLGVFLFHTLFIVSPSAGRELFGDPQIGEYFRVFVAYGVIAVALVMYSWRSIIQAKRREKAEDAHEVPSVDPYTASGGSGPIGD